MCNKDWEDLDSKENQHDSYTQKRGDKGYNKIVDVDRKARDWFKGNFRDKIIYHLNLCVLRE